MTIKAGTTATASGNDNSLPGHVAVPKPQLGVLITSTKELLVRVAALEASNRCLTLQLRSAAEHAQFRLSEVQHRLSNTFSIMQALVAQTARPGDTGEAFRTNFGPRLLALARSHEFLGAGYPKGAPLDTMVTRCLEPFDNKPNRITMAGPKVHLRAKDVLLVSLALHELTTNAAKHGALSVSEGGIDVRWSVEARRTDRAPSVIITWREWGGPAVVPPSRRGFGSRLLERGLSQSSDGGATQLDFAPQGVECRIRLPLPNSLDTAEA